MASATGRKQASKLERGLDLYESPPEAVWALLANERLPGCIWEPACGPGAIVRILRGLGRTVYATDIKDWGCPDSQSRVDFLLEPLAPACIEAIVTNPPYMLANAFVSHAVLLAPLVYMLLPLQFLEGGQRDPRRDRLIDGGQLARVLMFRERLPMMHRHGWEGKKSTSTQCFAWFVWDREHDGLPTIKRISWRKALADAPNAEGRVPCSF